MPEFLAVWLTPWWSDWAAFWAMGRHGAYVWPCVGITALVLALEWWGLCRQRRRLADRAVERTPS